MRVGRRFSRVNQNCQPCPATGLLSRISSFVFISGFLWLMSCSSPMPVDVQEAYSNISGEVDFNFDIRPILADRCYPCHGPDEQKREAGLRLDLQSSALGQLENSGKYAFKKGELDQSIAWQRIISEDPELMMPPPESNLALEPFEKARIAQWIEQGANWKEHWAFIAPTEQKIPTNLPEKWLRINPIDHFIQAKLQTQNLVPSIQADKERLIRRLSFDLTGLPPSLSDVDAFVSDTSGNAYERLVDRLLSSEAHAERLAMEWLDVSRYADSHGMHADGLRVMWRWRDWVIDAFKRNQAYDQFVTWQIAGDLLPNATTRQRLATGFYRNQPLNSESGIVPEEYRLKYVADRTNTTGTAFLGLTMECASCHDHKFDPISQKEYYELSAFFNNVQELGMIGNDLNFGPLLLLPDSVADRKIKVLNNQIERLEAQKDQLVSEVESLKDYVNEIRSNQIELPDPIAEFDFDGFKSKKNKVGRTIIEVDDNPRIIANGTPEIVAGHIRNAIRINSDYDQIYFQDFNHFDACDEFSAGAWIKTEKIRSFQSIIGNIGDKNTGWRGWLFFIDTLNRPGLKLVHNLSCNYIHVVAEESIDVDQWTHLFFAYDGSASAAGVRLYANGKPLTLQVHADHLYKNIRPVKYRNYQPDPGRNIRMGIGSKYLFSETDDGVFYGAFDQVSIYDQFLTTPEIAQLAGSAFDFNEKSFSNEQLLEYYLDRKHGDFQKIDRELQKLRKEKFAIVDEIEEVMVMEDMPEVRNTFILNRGQYDDLGAQVFASTPEAILPFGPQYPKNRLGLAQWLFASDHPLTARVAVNRYWQMIFGHGIVNTPHDFGSQGALPSHPELIDWLAIEFRNSGWNLRSLLKMMVMSATYRQSSVITSESKEMDPKNIWLARAPSLRMQMEMIRDNALAASGLLNPLAGGPSVKPYQPEGLWKEKNEFSGFLIEYEHDQGADLYRRSMYTFIRRTSPPPIMTTFDAPARDVCTVKRETTNTPLQALVLLNDPQFIEAARILAERVQKEEGQTIEERISKAFRLVCGRRPSVQELKTLFQQHQYESLRFRENPKAADDLLCVGERPADKKLDTTQTAALAVVCNTIMNFDEAYMKR